MTNTTALQTAVWRRFGVPAVAFWGALTLVGCASPAERAARYAAEAQGAAVAGDSWTARERLLRAVKEKDDVAEYWSALGGLQLRLGSFGQAYYAYSRAVELDRDNPAALQSIADLALMGGRLDEAEEYVEQMILLAPGTPGPLTTKGFIELSRSRPEAALKLADEVLAKVPNDSAGSVLKARALEELGDAPAAVALLEKQLAIRANDAAALQNLLTIYGHSNDAEGVLRTRARILRLQPDNVDHQFNYATALYAAGQIDEARTLTVKLIEERKLRRRLGDILSIWLQHEPREANLALVRRLAANADAGERVAYARYFLAAGKPAEAEALVRPAGERPLSTANVNAAALLGQARYDQGDRAAAERLWDAVLAFDSSNVLALRGRADLRLAIGRKQDALADARKLVTENPVAPTDRLRLARTYVALGDLRLAEAAYWDAFRDIPANPLLHRQLKAFLVKTGKRDRVATVDQQYLEQKRLADARG